MGTKKLIEPQYLYDAKGKATHVYMSIDDYNRFAEKFAKLEKEAAPFMKKPKNRAKKR